MRTVFVALAIALAVTACKESSAGSENVVPITVDGKGFTPSSIDVKKGKPATLLFTRTTDETCAKEVVFPEINVRKELPLNKPVGVDVPTDKERTLTFQCGMAMFKSSVVIH
jgi:plastocyanin domain-containing protein